MLRIWYCNFPLLKLNDQVKTVLLLHVYSNYTKHNNGLDGDVARLLCWSANVTMQPLCPWSAITQVVTSQ